jgi:hypothetical protein
MGHRPALSSALFVAICTIACAADIEPRKSSVGMPTRIEGLVLRGTQLEAKPIESRETPLVVRIVAVYPHGTAFRYDLEYHALDPGKHDLRSALKRKDGSTTDDLPPLAVEVVSLLPPGQVEPNALTAQAAPRLGGYTLLLIAVVVGWVAGLAALLLVRRRAAAQADQAPARRLSLAERLQPLVSAAVAGTLDRAGQAELERLLLTFWRKRLDLQETDPVQAVVLLREHPEAGALLRQVESWLHKPGGAGEVDIAAILAPYRDLPADSSAAPAPHASLQASGSGATR